jgi:hypothetical protein
MRAKTLKQTLKDLFKIKRTVAIEGSPGGGKTTICREVADEMGVGFIEVHMPTMLVEDFGIPMPQPDGTIKHTLPHWYPAVGSDHPETGILCFDDMNQANADLQKVVANMCQAGTLHGVPKKEGWQVVSTGNKVSDRAGANRILSHLRNRHTVYDLETHVDDWLAWAIDHDVKPEVISFIKFRTDLLHDFDPQRESNPTPRSWVEGVSNTIGLVSPEAEYETFKGAVGEGASAEFVGFVKIFRNLPDMEQVIKKPLEAIVPNDPATLYAMAGSLATYSTVDNFKNVLTYLDRIPPEFSVLSVSYAVKKNTDLMNTPEFTKWAVDKQNVII